LSWLSLAWMTVEGGVAIAAGVVAGSIALVGFGLDSAIEGFASVIIVWRFTGHRVFSQAAEDRAQKLVAVQFFLLAPYVAFESVKTLVAGDHPKVSWVGIGLSVGSVVLMPMLAVAKQRLADQLGSAATAGEARNSRRQSVEQNHSSSPSCCSRAAGGASTDLPQTGSVRVSLWRSRYRGSGRSTPRSNLTPAGSTSIPPSDRCATTSVISVSPAVAWLVTRDAMLTVVPR